MKGKTTAQALEAVGPQEYSLAFNGSVSDIQNPLEIWSPPSNRRILTADELYDVFSKECVAFLGDSTERRAADTLQILLSNRHNVSGIQKYYHWYDNTHEDNYRVNLVDGVKRTKECFPGTIDSVHLPTYDKILTFRYPHEYQKNYSIIVASTGPWNQKAGPKSPKETREHIRRVITHLYNEIPDDVVLIWKTGVWSWHGDWIELKDNETIAVSKLVGNNYLVHYANQVAKETILAINSTRLLLLDFAREICPYSWEYRLPTNMAAEDEDRVTWHYGAKARLLLAQMVGWEVASYRNNTLPSGGFGNGRGIESDKNNSQNSRETFQGSAAKTIISESNEIRLDDNGNRHRIDENSTTSQIVDLPIENHTFPGKASPTNASSSLVDSMTLWNYTRNPTIVQENPTTSFMFDSPNTSFRVEVIRFGAIVIVLYGIKMKLKSRSISHSKTFEVESQIE